MVSPGATPSSTLADSERRWRIYLEGIRARNPESLAKLYDETSRLLFGLALRVLNDSADAEEVILDVYQRIWNSAGSFDAARGTAWSWLAVMTRNRAIDRLRQAGNRKTREVPIEGFETPNPAPLQETQTIFQQERTLVRNALESLAPDQREAIELAFFRGLSHTEVADALGAPLGTIKSRIRTGIQKLREALQPMRLAGEL